jgi:ribonuclease BN (tRNA processing enzyme)
MKNLKLFLRRPYTTPALLLPTKMRFHAVNGGSKGPIKFDTEKMRHSVTCHGYKFYAEGRTVSYCTDTGPGSGLKKLARGADLLITECALAPRSGLAPQGGSPNPFHITPEDAASIARDMGAKKLALFHFDPAKYPTKESRQGAESAAKAIFEKTVAANDGTIVEI